MFENIITFEATEEFIENNQDNLPIPAKINMPEWYKKLENSADNKTVKGCIPFLDTLTAGYILKMPVDFHVKHNVLHEGIKATGVTTSQRYENEFSQKINLNYQEKIEIHPPKQLKGSPYLEKNKNFPIHKIMNPWIIKTPPGYSTLFVPPLNNTDDRFSIIPGIVDTDTFNIEVNFPIVFNGDKYPSLTTTLERGTPYVQLIPFKREKWKMKVTKRDEQKFKKDKFFMQQFIINNYKKKFWSKKSFK